MRSITYLTKVNKRATLTTYENAVAIRPSGFYGVKTMNLSGLRSTKGADGRIKGMSKNSLARLREAIARTRHKETAYSLYGVCLTIPWGKDGELSQEDGREIWRIFQNQAARAFARLGIGALFRVELQEREAVHWHLILYLPDSMDEQRALRLLTRQHLPKGFSLFCSATQKSMDGRRRRVVSAGVMKAHYYAISYLRILWANSCNAYHLKLQAKAAPDTLPLADAGGGVPAAAVPSPIHSWDYCLHSFPLDGVMSGIGYLASHTSKHKQEQLGYVGKQWGYIGKSSLVVDSGVPSASFDALTDPQRVRAFRTIRNWCKINRPKSAWYKVRPSRLVTRGGVEIFNGLSVRNHYRLYLFGIPDTVFKQAIEGARN